MEQGRFLRQSSLFLMFITILSLLTGGMLFTIAASQTEAAPPKGKDGGPTIELVEIANGFDKTVDLANAGDERLFVVEREGQIKIINADGTVLSEPFLDIQENVSLSFQGGLLGLAFHPNYEENGYFFVNYTAPQADNTDLLESRISRFAVSQDNANVANPASEVRLLVLEQPYDDNNGGDLAFGPDGYLYIPLGDGGTQPPQDGPNTAAQDGSTLLGKMLRLEPSLTELADPPYTIPADNPFISDPAVLNEIWAFGLRNPWHFSFDRQTGDIYIGDVGEHEREEIDFQLASSSGGENYGWPCYEGSIVYNNKGCEAQENYDFPIDEYDHTIGNVVTGGIVYRGSNYPALQGYYFFADFTRGSLWSLIRDAQQQWQRVEMDVSTQTYSTFGEDAAGELYVASYGFGTGIVYRIVEGSEATSTPTMTPEASSTSMMTPEVSSTPTMTPEASSTPTMTPEASSTLTMTPSETTTLTPTSTIASTASATVSPKVTSTTTISLIEELYLPLVLSRN